MGVALKVGGVLAPGISPPVPVRASLKDVCPSCPQDSRIAASMSYLGSRIAAYQATSSPRAYHCGQPTFPQWKVNLLGGIRTHASLEP